MQKNRPRLLVRNPQMSIATITCIAGKSMLFSLKKNWLQEQVHQNLQEKGFTEASAMEIDSEAEGKILSSSW